MSIRRPVTTFVVMAAFFVFGFIGFSRLGVDLFPKVEFPVVTVITVLEGASPDVVEENITDVIEEEVSTVEGVRNLTSVSSHGASVVTIEFEMERAIDLAAQDVRDRINGILGQLPEDTETPLVSKLDIQSQPVMWIAVSGERPIQEVTGFAEDTLKPRLESIKGVGSIILGGKRERTVRIWLDRDKLASRGITSDDVVTALKRENVEIPGGFLESKDIEFSVKVEGEFAGVESFNDLIIASRKGSGVQVKLRDVGYAEDGLEDKRSLARYNGEPAVGLGIRKKAGANTVEMARLVRAEVEGARKDLPAGMKVRVAFDASVFIEESMREMEFALVFGGLLAAAIVLIFLRNVASAFITAVAIPLSIVGTFIFIYFMGFTLNTMTMLGLTLAIGVVIDDAIIVVDNINRHMDAGSGPVEAARKGTNEIAFAAMAATFSLGAVFVPVAFMKGVVGRFFYEFGLTVAISIFISLFVALTLTPMLSSKLLRRAEAEPRIFALLDSFYGRLEGVYRNLLRASLSHRLFVVGASLAVFAASLFIWTALGKEFIPSEDQSRFIVRFETPVGSSMDYTDSKLKKNEQTLKGLPEIMGFFGAVGLGDSAAVNKGLMFVRMSPKEERKRSQQDVVSLLRKELNREPGQRAFAESLAGGFGARRGPPLEFTIKGPSLEKLNGYSREIAERFSKIPGIVDVDTDFDVGLPEVKVYIDRARAADAGIDATALASAVNVLIGGKDVSRYKEGGKRFDVRVKLIPSQRGLPRDIERLYVRDREGRLVRLAGFVRLDEGVSPSVINRRDRERSITVFANTEGEKTLASAIEDITRISKEVLPEGFTTKLGGSAELFKESMFSMFAAFALAIVITYMVLASQFESFVHPFTVMLALPLSIVGALGLLWVTGNTINIYSLIGIILLVGLVTKNSILLVDYTNTLRAGGMAMREAVLKAGPVRLRPILMTALSTICGVVPTAVGIGPGSESRAPMAIAAIGGLTTSTLLTLFVVPVVYTIIDDVSVRLRRR
ncbi:MAG: efflux RND transporter permease subunit [Deltaproteobacteria bacterium]|nr:efflux RND transporter permease subunit [Deltaproteobacteria bacterium]